MGKQEEEQGIFFKENKRLKNGSKGFLSKNHVLLFQVRMEMIIGKKMRIGNDLTNADIIVYGEDTHGK